MNRRKRALDRPASLNTNTKKKNDAEQLDANSKTRNYYLSYLTFYSNRKILLCFSALLIFVCVLTSFYLLIRNQATTIEIKSEIINSSNVSNSKKHKLALVVPFRDRFDELLLFVPHVSEFLRSKSIDFGIFVINQVDEYRFNRASLINVGFLTSMMMTSDDKTEFDYMIMHDVDLLPLNTNLDYSYPEATRRPFHLSAPGLHPDYSYATFIGGVLLVTKENFLATNGMSNRYFGWGKEDDEFYLRLRRANLTVDRPDLTLFGNTGNRSTFAHNHRAERRARDKKRFRKQKREALMRDSTGLDTIQYRIVSKRELTIDEHSCTIVNVELFCDRADTHWCSFDYQFVE